MVENYNQVQHAKSDNVSKRLGIRYLDTSTVHIKMTHLNDTIT